MGRRVGGRVVSGHAQHSACRSPWCKAWYHCWWLDFPVLGCLHSCTGLWHSLMACIDMGSTQLIHCVVVTDCYAQSVVAQECVTGSAWSIDFEVRAHVCRVVKWADVRASSTVEGRCAGQGCLGTCGSCYVRAQGNQRCSSKSQLSQFNKAVACSCLGERVTLSRL